MAGRYGGTYARTDICSVSAVCIRIRAFSEICAYHITDMASRDGIA